MSCGNNYTVIISTDRITLLSTIWVTNNKTDGNLCTDANAIRYFFEKIKILSPKNISSLLYCRWYLLIKLNDGTLMSSESGLWKGSGWLKIFTIIER